LMLPAEFESTLEKMLQALFLLSRGGLPPRFGDDDGGRVFDPTRNNSEHLLDPLATGAVLFGRGDFKFVAGGLREETLWLLGEAGLAEWEHIDANPPQNNSAAMADSGFYLMPTGRNCQLVVDAGPLGTVAAGHGQADALRVCVMSHGHEFLIDSGTLDYVGPSPERNMPGGTGAHNTMRVDGAGRADVNGPFSSGRDPDARVEQWIQGESFDLFVGSHGGYTRVTDRVIHRRWIFCLKDNFWFIRDVAAGEGHHNLEISWHFGPEIQVQKDNVFGVRNGDVRMAVLAAAAHGWSEEGHKDWFSPRYRQKQSNLVVNFATRAELPTEFATLLVPLDQQSAQIGKFVAVSSRESRGFAQEYRYVTPDGTHGMFFGEAGEPWKSGAWASDAEFLYLGLDSRAEVRHVILCNGSWIAMRDRHLLNSCGMVSCCELIVEGTAIRILPSARHSVSVSNPFDVSSCDAAIFNEDSAVSDLTE
jgi:Heparinase II/III-like protein